MVISTVQSQAGHRSGQRSGAGRALHRDGHRVVDQQCHGGDLGDLRPEVVASHDVGAARLRVVPDDVEVGERDEEAAPR